MATALYIDADACPVKEEVYRVARRCGLKVFVVSNAWINTPREPLIEQVVVDAGPDVADDWIAERAGPGDIVITADIPLADRCLKAGAQVIQHNGEVLTMANIGPRLATRDLMQDIRSANPFHQGGGAGFGKADRARFLQSLDRVMVAAQRVPRG